MRARGPCGFFGDRLVNLVRSQRVSVCDDLFLHIQRDKSLPQGLPISNLNLDIFGYFPRYSKQSVVRARDAWNFVWTKANHISLQGSYSWLMLFTGGLPDVFPVRGWNLNTLRLI